MSAYTVQCTVLYKVIQRNQVNTGKYKAGEDLKAFFFACSRLMTSGYFPPWDCCLFLFHCRGFAYGFEAVGIRVSTEPLTPILTSGGPKGASLF
jgi:hypothetical protein